jgi:V/A-type H+-transporting ATPase subunit I
MVTKETDDDLIALFVVPERYASEVQELLGHEDISRLQMPDDLKGSPPDSAVTIIEHRMDQIARRLDKLEDRLELVAQDWGARLLSWRDRLQDELEVLEVLTKLGETDRTFVIAGWIPSRDLDQLRAALEKSFGDRVYLSSHPITPELEDRAPIVLQNPKPAQPFESLVELLHLPSYTGIDPTGLMALILPLFFGMILGDAGYGVVVLGLCLLLMRRFREGVMSDLLVVLAIGGGWSILFGILFGEAFGTLGEELGMPAIWFHRGSGETIPLLLAVTIGVGAAHITLGVLISAWEALRERSRTHLMESGGMLLGLISLFLLIGMLVEFLPQNFMTPSLAGLIVGIVLLSASYGWTGILLGPLEFIGLLGNILSYLRIAAIGLASVFLAQVANEIAGLLGSLVVGVIVAALIHAINIVLGMFSPTIQSLRLHYVEFFQKFYEESGEPFQPFKSRFVTVGERSE